MQKSKIIKRVIDGVAFTFECVRSKHIGFDNKVTYSYSWYWGADILSGKKLAISGTHSIKAGIKYQVKAAKMQIIINSRDND